MGYSLLVDGDGMNALFEREAKRFAPGFMAG